MVPGRWFYTDRPGAGERARMLQTRQCAQKRPSVKAGCKVIFERLIHFLEHSGKVLALLKLEAAGVENMLPQAGLRTYSIKAAPG